MSYLSYYNMLDDFSAGAGVLDNKELFTEDEQQTFLPRDIPNIQLSNPFSKIFLYNDIKTLIGLIFFVLAITATPVIAIIMLGVASMLLPFPSLVISYCLAIQILNTNNNSNRSIGLSIFCILMSIVTIITNIISTSSVFYIISYVILAILFCMYMFNLSKVNTTIPSKCKVSNFNGIMPSFSEDLQR
nr:IMV membrane protein [Wadden Sea poxvirus]